MSMASFRSSHSAGTAAWRAEVPAPPVYAGAGGGASAAETAPAKHAKMGTMGATGKAAIASPHVSSDARDHDPRGAAEDCSSRGAGRRPGGGPSPMGSEGYSDPYNMAPVIEGSGSPCR